MYIIINTVINIYNLVSNFVISNLNKAPFFLFFH